jgi:hypothetical protein
MDHQTVTRTALATHLANRSCVLLAFPLAACCQDVLLYYGASKYGSGPPALGSRSPRNSYNPLADDFMRERGSYQQVFEHP